MLNLRKRSILAVLWLAATAVAGSAQTNGNPVAAARELYASARYDEALTILNGLTPAEFSDRKSIEQYRSLCLLALGREAEAESAIAAVVTADPMYQPSEAEASPRVRAAFTEVRRRLLPEIATARYTVAKTAYDRKEHAAAEAMFRQLIVLLDDPDMGGRMADLRTLAGGFLELSARAAVPAPEPKHAEPSPPPAPAPVPGRVYGADDPGVTAAVAINQDFPRLPSSIASQARDRGVIEVVIDEQGRVVHAQIRTSVHAVYDSQLMMAVRDWRYQPATLAGQRVKYRKMIQIAIAK
jgi:TonB family protein